MSILHNHKYNIFLTISFYTDLMSEQIHDNAAMLKDDATTRTDSNNDDNDFEKLNVNGD